MKRKIYVGLVLTAMLMALGMLPSPAQSLQDDAGWVQGTANTSLAASASWFIDTLDTASDVGQHVSVAFAPDNGPTYISYYDATYHDLRMAKFVGSGGNCGPGNTWACETVDSTGDVGRYSSIKVDPSDNYPIIAYYDASNGALKLAIGSVMGWIIKTVDEPLLGSAGSYASLALSSTGKPRIAYYGNSTATDGDLKIAYQRLQVFLPLALRNG